MVKNNSKINENMLNNSKNNDENTEGKMSRFLFGFSAFLIATAIMLAVFGGAFYFVIHNNVNGLGETYRDRIMNIPVLNLALPVPPDPEDPKYLTEDQLKKKYNELRAERDKLKAELTKQRQESEKKIAELSKYKDVAGSVQEENEKMKKDIEAQKLVLEEKEKKLEDDKKKFDEHVASKDKTGFKEFYEGINGETAQKIYSEIVKQETEDAEAKKFAQKYEAMEPSAVAEILTQLGNDKMDLTIDILKNMKKENYAAVVEAMDPDFAAKVTEEMSKLYITDKSDGQ